ncbi:RHS repeat-associated core domain-containing protein [Paracholeplasma manati]|uniref:RHS repeat-associated core domain-containing protein n=1 Tax=Paracholeplasma manati TaxID=591373 RepID=UPI0040379FE4
MVTYSYDAFGNTLNITDTSGISLSTINPYRYRGYRYDLETGFYYLQSRYYNPQIGRFISPDSINYLNPMSNSGENLYTYTANNPVMYTDPSGRFFISFLVASIIVGAVIGGTVNGYTAYQSGERGWDLIFDIAGGAIMGSAVGAALALGGAAGLAATGATVAGFGLSTTAAFGIAVAGTTIGGMVAYSLDVAGTQTEQWNWGKFALAGLEGGLQGASTFGIAYFGGNHGLFNQLGNFGSPSDFFIRMVAQKGTMGFIKSFFYGSSMLVGEAGARMVFVSGVGFVARWIIDKIIYGV